MSFVDLTGCPCKIVQNQTCCNVLSVKRKIILYSQDHTFYMILFALGYRISLLHHVTYSL